MRQQWRRYDVADCIHTFLSRLLILVNLDETLLDFNLRLFQSETFREGHATDRNEQHLSFKSHVFTFGSLASDDDSVFSLLKFLELGIDLRFDAAFAE